MAINCASLWDDVVSQVGGGTATAKLQGKFVRAVNRALDELAHRSNTAAWTHITGPTSVISMDEDYEYVLYAGVVRNLMRQGERPSDPRLAEIVYRESKEAWNDAIGNYIANVTNEASANTDSNIAKLGSVTSTDTDI